MQRNVATAILEQLAEERRRVFADWRALILLRRATFALEPSQRRWSRLPTSVADVQPYLRQMARRGQITPLERQPHIYQVTVPYARTAPISEDEILMEVHPYATLAYLSALVFHNLTDILPKGITAVVPRQVGSIDLLPTGTNAEDWIDLDLVPGRRTPRVLDRPVKWVNLKPERLFGIQQYRPRGYPVRVTIPERTLIDGLLEPELSGGIDNVLEAWRESQDILDLQTTVALVDRFDINVLRQRVGFILEELGFRDPRLDRWQKSATRGGSSKLVASAPYADTFNERWSISINAPISALSEA